MIFLYLNQKLTKMKSFRLLILGILVSTSAIGQILNVQTGTSFSKLVWKDGDKDTDQYGTMLIGYSAFIGLDYVDKKYINLSTNLGLIRKGGKDKVVVTNANGEALSELSTKATLDYVSLNTTIELKYPIKEKIMPYISIGPRFDYLIKNSYYLEVLKQNNDLNKINVGLILGGGIKFDLPAIQLGLRADYYLNFMKVAEWPTRYNTTNGSVNDQTMSLNFTIGFKI